MSELTDLDIKKMMAEIEFSGENDLVLSIGCNGDLNFRHSVKIGVVYGLYNPYEWTRLGPLMVEYEVIPCYVSQSCYIVDENAGEYNDGCIASVNFSDESEIPRAICLCILESKGLV